MGVQRNKFMQANPQIRKQIDKYINNQMSRFIVKQTQYGQYKQQATRYLYWQVNEIQTYRQADKLLSRQGYI